MFLRSAQSQPVAYYLLRFVILLSIPLYLFLPVALQGQTPGHRVCGIICLQPDGHIVTIHQALIRSLMQYCPPLRSSSARLDDLG
jgi:uncharacterized RDD family membrane protein YckC